MDAYYAAVEERDDPTLRGRPIAVGGGTARGVVLTASYAARRFGVRSAMPGVTAARLCPDLVFVRPRFAAYKAVSDQIRAVFRRYTPLVEPVSLDEAYLDVTAMVPEGAAATDLARAIKAEIQSVTGLTASAGVSYNKFLAKLASDMRKPDGLCVIRPTAARRVLAALPVERFHGVGPATARRLRAAGILTGADLQAWSEPEAVARLGRVGGWYWRLAQGIDERPVAPGHQRKSQSVETTFRCDLVDPADLGAALDELALDLAARLERSGFVAGTITLKIKYWNFRVSTRQATLREAPRRATDLAAAGRRLLQRAPLAGPVRLLGLGVAGTAAASDQLALPLGEAPLPSPGDDAAQG